MRITSSISISNIEELNLGPDEKGPDSDERGAE